MDSVWGRKDLDSEREYVWMKYGTITYESCYFTRNEPIANFQTKLDHLETENGRARNCRRSVNAKALKLGMELTDGRGE